MADENTTSATDTAASASTAPKRATAKRKAAPKTAASKTATTRRGPGRPRAASKSAAVKTVEKVEAKARTYKRRATKAATAYERDAEKAATKLAGRARAVSRNAFLASLGFYGKAYDEMQARLDRLQARLDARGKAANVAYADLVKRGSKVEKDAKGLISEIELPRLELDALKDRKKLEARLAKARARFDELRASVGFRSAA
ncbi:MAG: hypothetical protein RJQ10_07340 [Haliea sp.]|uniref:hypothetical protein n=1 Tax=Haliea sp. TaxID=1932666 RepID=UPI0032ED424A